MANLSDIPRQFGGIGRLYGPDGYEKLKKSTIMIIGIGGVGSWAAELLARSGVGKLRLVDLDDVCESNINRQIHATHPEIGKPKISAMRERIQLIAPQCEVIEHHEFFTQSSSESLLETEPDVIFDAIDSLRHKILLLKLCRRRKIPLLISGGAGGRMDPTKIQIEDLARTKNDKLLQKMRKELRMKHGFPRDLKKKFGATCVYSPELAKLPEEDPESCDPLEKTSRKLDCETGYGTAGFVTGAFGMAAASWIVGKLVKS